MIIHFFKKNNRIPGCQIDYLIKTRFNNLYMCEIKFSRYPIDTNIIAEMQKKLVTFYYPKNFSCRPILIHVNGVKEKERESGFFLILLILVIC